MKYRVITVFGTNERLGTFGDLFVKMNRNLILSLLTVTFFILSGKVISQPLQADAGADQEMCDGSTVVIGGSPAASGGGGSYSYNWSPAAGLSCTNCANPVCTVASTTTYTLTVNSGGNTDSDQVTVSVNPAPSASFTFSPNNQCSNVPVVFANTSTSGSGITYSWNFGNPASGASNSSSAMNPNHIFVATGNSTESFNVTLTVTTSDGCTATSNQTVTVNQSPSAELLDPFTNFRNCDGSSFDLQVYDNSTPATNSQYYLDWGDGSAAFSGASMPGGGMLHTYSSMGIYTLTYIVTGSNSCSDTVVQLVSNITNPAIGVANPGNTNGCGPITLCFPLSNYAGNHSSSTYRVNYGDGSPEDVFNHPPPAQVCHTYSESSCALAGGAFTFSITARNNCDSSTATVTPIRVYTGPQAHFDPVPTTQCVNVPVTFNNTSVLGFNSTCSSSTIFVWDFGDGSTTTVFNANPQSHTYSTPGSYTVTLSV